MTSRIALYGKHPKQQYYRLLWIGLDARLAATRGRKLRDARAVDMWFTKEFPFGDNIPARYSRVPLQHNQKNTMKYYTNQPFIRTCPKCKGFRKYGTTRREKPGEKICSVCGKPISKGEG